jgi:cyclic pyranopterin monophosphate synthase
MKMVDVGGKERTERVAIATCRVRMNPQTLELVRRGKVEKGNVLEAARLAAVMAAKKTPDLIPLCHPIALTGITAEVTPGERSVEIRVQVKTVDRTGVEMEALTGACAAALTVYDMLKSQERGMVIERVQLEHKSGGRTGTWQRTTRAAARRARAR